MKSEQNDEIIYNPYNDNNKEITTKSIKTILNTFNVYYDIKNIERFQRAFVHRSYVKPQKLNEDVIMATKPPNCLELKSFSNERLEFLGDSILSSIISSYLFKNIPSGSEGYLTQMRAKIVSRNHLNELGIELDLLKLVQSNISDENFGDNIHGNLFESLIGAIFLDRGYKFCKQFINEKVIDPHVDLERLKNKIISYKSLFI